MAESDGEYRAASDLMLGTLRRLREIEEAKRRVGVGTPEFVRFAAECEALSRRVFTWSRFQQMLAEGSPTARVRGNVSGRPIEDLVARPLDRILAAWREAEVRFRDAMPGSPEAQQAAADIERLRAEYHDTQDGKLPRGDA